jgi:hypothetical protein
MNVGVLVRAATLVLGPMIFAMLMNAGIRKIVLEAAIGAVVRCSLFNKKDRKVQNRV